MDYEGLMKMTEYYAKVLTAEHTAKIDLANAQADTAGIRAHELAKAYEMGQIDGKNADIRKAQETAFMATNRAVGEAVNAEAETEQKAAAKEIERKRIEAVISLTKAWLYSQSGRE